MKKKRKKVREKKCSNSSLSTLIHSQITKTSPTKQQLSRPKSFSLLLVLSNQQWEPLSLFFSQSLRITHILIRFLLSFSLTLSLMSNCTVESSQVETSDGVKLHTRLFKPREEIKDNNLVIVLVHPFSILGGCQGLLRGIAGGLADKGYKAVTFDMRGAGRSTGRPSLTGFAEIKDVIAVCKWVSQNLSADRILLVGSSAGIIFYWFFFAPNFISFNGLSTFKACRFLCYNDWITFVNVLGWWFCGSSKLVVICGYDQTPL